MKPFLQQVALKLFEDYAGRIQEICLVFPNRRSGLFFRNYLSTLSANALWSPQIFTIDEFIRRFSPLKPADPMDLVFRLYAVYTGSMGKPESLDEFWNWGEMVLSDFDDIDKYLIDAGAVYSNIRDLKEIDSRFGLSEEQIEVVRKFWGYFPGEGLSVHKEKFLQLWEILPILYDQLKSQLRLEGLAYEGMIYRDLAEKIKTGDFPELPWERIAVCGFNALNNAEKEVFRFLRNSGKADFYWDYAPFYTDDPVMEAGRFMRQNLTDFPPVPLPSDPGESFRADIRIYEFPSDVSQVKYLGPLLSPEKAEDLHIFSHTAVILADEDLLVPALTSFPENVTDINITMGYPLGSTPVFSFTDQLLKMQKNIARQKNRKVNRFYYKDVLSVLNHQYLKISCEEEVNQLHAWINEHNLIYIGEEFFSGNPIIRMIFRRAGDTRDLILYLRDILLAIAHELKEKGEEEGFRMEKEFIYHVLLSLNKLSEILTGVTYPVDLDIITSLIRKILSVQRIPFEGEPLAGVQVMGLLESRLLDFNHVVILSVNEGVLPGTRRVFSYIPAGLRKGFGMPVQEDHDAIYAYYFYRLLQRAGRVSLFYNNRSDGLGSGERSRLIHQLEYDPRLNTEFTSIGFTIPGTNGTPLTITKTSILLDQLKETWSSGKRYLSPSSLNNYLNCRLRFYFSHVARLRETDTVSEEIEADTFGTLLHEAMYLCYREYEGKTLQSADILRIMQPENVKRNMDQAFRKVYYRIDDPDVPVVPEGKNIIVHEVLTRYVTQILTLDKEFAPFRMVSLEKEITSLPDITVMGQKMNIRLGGKIDRIDEKGGIIRIIDYKTGKTDLNIKSIESLFDRNDEKRNAAAFQTLLYCMFLNKETPAARMVPGLYAMRRLFEPGISPEVTLGTTPVNYSAVAIEFEDHVYRLLAEIMNPDVPFDQTTIKRNCEYCPYSGICHRKNPVPS